MNHRPAGPLFGKDARGWERMRADNLTDTWLHSFARAKDKVSAALKQLAAEHARSPKCQTARLREVLDDVEAALAAGASHAPVLATLHAQGFTFTLRSFESTLGRSRKELKTRAVHQKPIRAGARRLTR